MDEKQLREKAITKTSVIGILANVFLVAFKALAGLLSGSIAIILDAVNNLTDAISSIVTIIGVKLAKKKPETSSMVLLSASSLVTRRQVSLAQWA